MQTPLLAIVGRTGVIITLLWCAAAYAGVDVNTATEADLDGVKGIGPRTTALILTERARGPFKSWQDLMTRVKGIKPASAVKLSANGLTVGEAPFAPTPEKNP